MGGAVPPLPKYTFMAWCSVRGSTGTTLPSPPVDQHKSVYPKVSGLAAWSENCKWYSSLPLGAVVSLFRESF
jgi:hypothetical protein